MQLKFCDLHVQIFAQVGLGQLYFQGGRGLDVDHEVRYQIVF